MGAEPSETTRRTRPRDRKERIVAAAAIRFHRYGYHRVTMSAIAGDVGITAGALYRHFRNKRELLGRVITDRVATVARALAAGDRLDDVLAACARTALCVRDLGTLWQRDGRHLDRARRDEVQASVAALAAKLTGLIRAERPELPYDDAELLAWAVFAVLTSPGYHRTQLAPDRFAAVLHGMCAAVCAVGFPVAGGDYAAPEAPPVPAPTRPETLVAEAGRLFGERGYSAVTMEEIGAAAGIAGPSVYNHFPAKHDLLVAVLARSAARFRLDPHAPGAEPYAEIRSAARAYTAFGLTHPHTIGVLFTEVPHLPEEHRRYLVRTQRAYVAAWVSLLTAAGADPGTARIRAQAAFTIVNDLVRMRRLRVRADLGGALHALMLAVLDAGE